MIKEKYIKKVNGISINVVQTDIDSVRLKDIKRKGLRVYKDGLIGVAGAIGGYTEDMLMERAEKALESGISYPYQISTDRQEERDYRSEIIPEGKFVEEIEILLKQIRNAQPDFIFSNKINLTEYEVVLQNNRDLDLKYRDRLLEVGLIYKKKESANIMDGGIFFTGREYDRNQFLESINKVCNAFNNKVDLPAKEKLPVIFSTSDGLPLRKFLTDLNGNRFGSKRSIFADKLGERIFNTGFTLYQNNDPVDSHGTFFDAEGTVNKNYRYPLIEDGEIKAPFTDKRVADQFNLPHTGSARAEYDGVPSLGAPSLKIRDTGKTAKELLNGQPGIFVMVASGGDFTPEGNFATPVQLPLLFDGESFIGRLPELNVSSIVYEMFGESFIGVSNDSFLPLTKDRCLIMEMKVTKL